MKSVLGCFVLLFAIQSLSGCSVLLANTGIPNPNLSVIDPGGGVSTVGGRGWQGSEWLVGERGAQSAAQGGRSTWVHIGNSGHYHHGG
jgi:hypothetical protein